ncbi:MAG: 5-formyltetrahydrofolate cyclo-ligase [Candidatus Sumerlaeia bacterium]|nr:5-formyltetrahydrofolate cyclo-ligase [Candidatus Sumerlaeia bacterium]
MSEAAREAKRALRRDLRARLAAVAPEEARAATERLAALLLAQAETRGASVLAAYAAMPGELDCAPYLEARQAAGAALYLPRVVGRESLAFHRVEDLGGLEPLGPFGIREPDADAPLLDAGALRLVLVPGLAFTARGARLGRGRGYYDRFLAGLPPECLRVGVAYDWQVLDDLPTEAHDARLDALATPTRWMTRPTA